MRNIYVLKDNWRLIYNSFATNPLSFADKKKLIKLINRRKMYVKGYKYSIEIFSSQYVVKSIKEFKYFVKNNNP